MATTINALGVRKRLGPKEWSQPFGYGLDGWCWGSTDLTRSIIASTTWMDGVEWIHASLAYRDGKTMPTQDDVKLLHGAIFEGHYAYQVFDGGNAAEAHLFGRVDGKPGIALGLD